MPSTPPSRIKRFEPTPITVTGNSGGFSRRNFARSSASSGLNSQSARPPTPNQVLRAISAFGRSWPRKMVKSRESRVEMGDMYTRLSTLITGKRSERSRQRVRPFADGTSAEADHHVAFLADFRHQRRQFFLGCQRSTWRCPAREALGQRVAEMPSIGCSPAP